MKIIENIMRSLHVLIVLHLQNVTEDEFISLRFGCITHSYKIT